MNDASLLMLQHGTRGVSPQLAEQLASDTLALHQATTAGLDATREAARQLQQTTAEIRKLLLAHKFSVKDVEAMLVGLARQGIAGEYHDYGAAEQGYMAAQSLVATLERAGALQAGKLNQINAALADIDAALKSDDNYQSANLVAALKTLDAILSGN